MITRNNLHNNHLPIPTTHHPGNQDQQNHYRHPRALHAFPIHRYPLIIQIILFSTLHLDILLFFNLSLFCVGVCIAAAGFVRAVAV